MRSQDGQAKVPSQNKESKTECSQAVYEDENVAKMPVAGCFCVPGGREGGRGGEGSDGITVLIALELLFLAIFAHPDQFLHLTKFLAIIVV